MSAFIALTFFLTRTPCRVITTSVDGSQLDGVLWGEIRRFVQECKYPLDHESGGPLVINELLIRKMYKPKQDAPPVRCGLSYLMGRVAAKGEGMLGHHIAKTGDNIPRTLAIFDEASGLDDTAYERCQTWADRILVIGNPYPCRNFFYKGVKGGDILAAGNYQCLGTSAR